MTQSANVDGTGSVAIGVLAEDEFGNTRVTLVNPQSGSVTHEVLFLDTAWRAQAVTVVGYLVTPYPYLQLLNSWAHTSEALAVRLHG